MAVPKYHLLYLPLLATVLNKVLPVSQASLMYPFSCSEHIQICNSYLYHISEGLSIDQIASFYSVNSSHIKPIIHGTKQDYLISVPCTCKDVNGTQGYFYDTSYRVQSGDTFINTSSILFSGQAWKVKNEVGLFIAGDTISIHLLCGCTEVQSQEIVTYTVQENDTLTGIAELLSARLSKLHYLTLTLATVSAVTFCSVCALILFLIRRLRNHKNNQEAVNKCHSPSKTSLQSYFHKNDIEDATFESERPVAYSVKEIDKATVTLTVA
ncbi:conserved hypothetical protein [Ricinus communis]|uniref:LysM domain-containing protein n=1 Tax=Ricinus communis TaxID=3988 RepID=B9RAW8_RICCO|nr:conserved hypothetical protein [Ricinus communis]